jgi:metal-responsive CopG/Arc/MetJ family transcriptional regulator
MKRMNITLPEEIVEFLKDKPNKSRYIAEALYEKVERERQERLRKKLVEGYKKEKQQGRTVNREWESATLESWD